MSTDRIAAVGHRIRELRMAAGLSLEELAERLGDGTHFTTIAKIERSQRTISLDWIMKIAAALGVSAATLVSAGEPMPTRLIPLIGSIAAGNWREAILDPEGMIPVAGAGPNAFALRPSGDSMDKVATEDHILVIDPDQPDLLDGKLYAVMNGFGETTFKRFRADPPRLEPASFNPDHQPIPLGREPFTVIGRVVWRMEKLD